MSIAENILEINKKIVTINFTNSESSQIIKDEKVSDYMIKLSDCYEKVSNEDSNYFKYKYLIKIILKHHLLPFNIL